MATPVKDIEKDFFLKVLFDEKIPVTCIRDRTQYTLVLDKPVSDAMYLKSNQPIRKLNDKENIELMFDYRNQAIIFNVDVISRTGIELICAVPDYMYKNLDRSFSRVIAPSEMQVQFTFRGDRYGLSFPKVSEFETGDMGDFIRNTDPRNLSGLIDQMAAWIKICASGYRLVIFKDVKPSTVEERVITETGKTLYLPSTKGNFPADDPYPRKRIITEEMFKRYLESTGIGDAYINSACDRFVKAKADNGIYSDAWMPILFQEYVIGYIHIWSNDEVNKIFDYSVVDTLFQFSKVLAYSLKLNGYFEKGKLKNDSINGKVIDISASGLLFAYPHSELFSALLPDSELTVKISIPGHSITAESVIVRRFKDNAFGYIGCRFHGVAKEDFRLLFEFIYGKPFSDSDADFFVGHL